MLRKIGLGIFGVLLLAFSVTPAQAQWAIGGSYEIRNQAPETGFGARVEKGISLPIPLVDLGVRATVSHFSEDNSIPRGEEGDFSFDREITSIDYGVTVLGKLELGLVKPYLGIGIGGSSSDMSIDNIDAGDVANPPEPEEINESEFTYHGLIGGEIGLVPVLNPFIEYRINDYSASMDLQSNQNEFEKSIKESNGRLIFGVTLRF